MVLGTDAAGTTPDGRRVLVHAAIGVDGHGVGPRERRSILSEKFPGALAERVSVPTANLIDIPDDMPFEIAACLPTAWLTAYALLFRGAGLTPGQSVLIQGAGGGVASAAIILARAAGVTVYATSRSAAKLHRACELGAIPIEHGERLPQRVDAVVETVGKATWSHSVASVKPGGIIAIAGATTGDATAAELTRIFFQEIRVQGVTLGTRDELTALVNFVAYNKISVPIDSIYTLTQLPQALGKMIDGNLFGKVVIVMETQ
jgi:NADPH:quinone reductase-like Zn-dependent oxidoreductase